MKRTSIFVIILLISVTAFTEANSWDWWQPTTNTGWSEHTNQPSQPVNPGWSGQTGDSWWSEPSQPIDPVWPSQPADPGWSQPGQPIDPVWPGQPSEPSEPSEPSPGLSDPQPIDPAKPIQPSQPENKVPFPRMSLSRDEQNLIEQVNAERVKEGLNPLQVDMDLVRIAKTKSHDMAANGYFSHSSPTLGSVYTMLDDAGVYYSRAGENIATTGSVGRAHQLFMNSSGHRANIMHSGYTHIGVGIVKYGTTYRITQVFIRK